MTPGPRDDWFTAEALRTFTSRTYRVSSASNRIGLRTEGPALDRAVPGELPSEGMVLGAVQVPRTAARSSSWRTTPPPGATR